MFLQLPLCLSCSTIVTPTCTQSPAAIWHQKEQYNCETMYRALSTTSEGKGVYLFTNAFQHVGNREHGIIIWPLKAMYKMNYCLTNLQCNKNKFKRFAYDTLLLENNLLSDEKIIQNSCEILLKIYFIIRLKFTF